MGCAVRLQTVAPKHSGPLTPNNPPSPSSPPPRMYGQGYPPQGQPYGQPYGQPMPGGPAYGQSGYGQPLTDYYGGGGFQPGYQPPAVPGYYGTAGYPAEAPAGGWVPAPAAAIVTVPLDQGFVPQATLAPLPQPVPQGEVRVGVCMCVGMHPLPAPPHVTLFYIVLLQLAWCVLCARVAPQRPCACRIVFVVAMAKCFVHACAWVRVRVLVSACVHDCTLVCVSVCDWAACFRFSFLFPTERVPESLIHLLPGGHPTIVRTC